MALNRQQRVAKERAALERRGAAGAQCAREQLGAAGRDGVQARGERAGHRAEDALGKVAALGRLLRQLRVEVGERNRLHLRPRERGWRRC